MTHPPICERCGNDYAEDGRLCRDCRAVEDESFDRYVSDVAAGRRGGEQVWP